MKIIVLTTFTPHHIYFVKKISRNYDIDNIIVEKECLAPPFNTYHAYEDERYDYKRKELLNDEDLKFNNFSKTFEFKNINDEACVKYISNQKPDVIICPLIGFDNSLNRLGRGGGYYDRSLHKYKNTIKIGFAYSIQKIKMIPIENHDISMDVIITEKAIYKKWKIIKEY